MNNKINTKTISSILLGFVLLSGSIALAGLPTAAFAEERTATHGFDAGVTIAATPAETEAALMTASASTICNVVGTPVDAQQLAVENTASQSFPTDGASYVLLSTGNAGILVPNTAAALQASFSTGGPDGLAFPADVQDGHGDDANDVAQVTIDCMIPVGVTTLTFDWGFGSEEPPTFTPNDFSDYFRTIGVIGNVLALPISGAPVTSNNIDQAGSELANPVTGSSAIPTAPFPSPDDSALNAVLCTGTSTVACVQPQTASIDVTAFQGGVVSFGFEVADDDDTILDSAAFIDNLDTDAAGEIVKTCDDGMNICKTVIIIEEVDDGVIAVNELITYEVTITAMNTLGEDILNAQVKDNFGGDVEISVPAQDEVDEIGDVTCEVKLKGKTQKPQVRCDANTFEDGEDIIGFSATVITDINPGQGKKSEPKNEYTSCGVHDMNSGATLSGELANGDLVEFSTDSVSVEVFDSADLTGDCDGDGFTDGDEIALGTDPFDPADFPACGGSSIVDVCVDGDGIATNLAGSFSIIKGQALTEWPTGFFNEGIDWFDQDGDLKWSSGDDIHLERTASCTTGDSNGSHDVGQDCPLLDIDSNLFNGQPVSCDLETGSFCGATRLADLDTIGIKFFDEEVLDNGFYTNGEDIIQDTNNNGIFD